jgi:hypothetical protein
MVLANLVEVPPIFRPSLTPHWDMRDTVRLTGAFVDQMGRTRCASVGNDHRLERPWVLDIELSSVPALRRYRL